MGLINSFRESRRNAEASNNLYIAAVEQARSQIFFLDFGVPDSVDGRFDLVIVHIMLLVRRLRQQGKAAADVSQALLNLMFADMDRNLREMGVGDLSVGRQVKKMAKAFYGRAETWEQALDQDIKSVRSALAETVYRSVDVSSEPISSLASYVMAADKHLAGQPTGAIVLGEVEFLVPQSEKSPS